MGLGLSAGSLAFQSRARPHRHQPFPSALEHNFGDVSWCRSRSAGSQPAVSRISNPQAPRHVDGAATFRVLWVWLQANSCCINCPRARLEGRPRRRRVLPSRFETAQPRWGAVCEAVTSPPRLLARGWAAIRSERGYLGRFCLFHMIDRLFSPGAVRGGSGTGSPS